MLQQKKLWDQFKDGKEAEQAWDSVAQKAAQKHPLKLLKQLPTMPGITPETARFLKWKSLKWMMQKDKGLKIFRHVIKKPWTHLKRYLKSLFSNRPFSKEGDFFYYGIRSFEDFQKLLQKPGTLFVLGFSYCHKPFECPSGRFTDECSHNLDHPVCQQCFIGKCVHAAPAKATVPLFIPTVHYIGQKIFELQEKHPDRQIIFLITACEMTLTMFADWGNMAAIKGIGVRLDGRICNTMRAFALSEEGIKPGLTVILEPTQQKMMEIIALRRTWENRS